MDEPVNLNQEQLTEPDNTLCASCHTNKAEEGHKVKLCAACRVRYINYPIPKWIKIFALGIVAVIILSLVRTQMYIAAAIHLGKGENAIEQSRFVTAQKEIAQVLQKFPNDLTANADMIIAGSYNLDFKAVGVAFNKISDKTIDDEDLVKRTTDALSFFGENTPKDTAMARKITAAQNDREELLQLEKQVDTVANDPAIKGYIANCLFGLKDYTSVEHIMDSVLKEQPDFMGGLRLMSATKRETGQYDDALAYCDKMLDINKEDLYAISQKAKIELKRKNDSQAALYAREVMNIDSTSDSALEAVAMVDYFAGRNKLCNLELEKIRVMAAATVDSVIFKRLTLIVNGSVIYR
jgi:tetratricopeptide (TPR) repeat protein